MASQSNNEQKHSTLQLFIHDQGANAPELYRETGAIELDSTATTPQVAFHTAPETRHSSCLPEVVDSLGCEDREEPASKSLYDRHSSKIMLFTILAFFLAVAIGIGVGVGLTRKTSSKSSNSSISTAQEVFPYHGTILEGSSLAVLASPNGPRRLFFQRRNGDIIQALFQASVNEWNTQVVVVENARNHTPISAIFSFWDGSLYLFYIRESGHVAMSRYSTDEGRWNPDLTIGAVDGKDMDFTTTNANANSLSATAILGPENKTDVTLLYEDLNGDMIMIRRTLTAPEIKWRVINTNFSTSHLFRSPFSSGSIMAGIGEIIVARSLYSYTLRDQGDYIITYQNETFRNLESVVLPGTDRFLPNTNDGGRFLLSIDKPGGMIYFSHSQVPYMGLSGQFPFSKAAALTDQSGKLIVYHQTNNLSIAETMWDFNLGGRINGTWIDYDN